MLERRSAVLRVAGRSLDPPSPFGSPCCGCYCSGSPCSRACYFHPWTDGGGGDGGGGGSQSTLQCWTCSYTPPLGGSPVGYASPHVQEPHVLRVTSRPLVRHGLRTPCRSSSTGIRSFATTLSHIPVGESPVIVAELEVTLGSSRQRRKCKTRRRSRRRKKKKKNTTNPFASRVGRNTQTAECTSGTRWLGRLFLWLGLLWELTGQHRVRWKETQTGSRWPQAGLFGGLCFGMFLLGIGAAAASDQIATTVGSSPPSADLLNPWISAQWLSVLRANHTSSWSNHRLRKEEGSGSCPGLASGVSSWNPPSPACPSARCETERLFHDDTGFNATPAASASQCLPYLSDSHQDCICAHGSGTKRIDVLRKTYLRHCYHYNLWHVLSDTLKQGIAQSSDQCYEYLRYLQELDDLAAWITCEFDQVMRRYDCGQTFSVKSTCRLCQTAYRNWVCSMVIPYWAGDIRMKPCRNFCHQVEQSCPYFLPAEKTGSGSQYAGEPAFLCIDPDVLQTQLQAENSAHGSESTCYRPCSLNYGLEPDVPPGYCSLNFPKSVTNGSGGRVPCIRGNGSHVLGNYSQTPGSSGAAMAAAVSASSSSTFSSSSGTTSVASDGTEQAENGGGGASGGGGGGSGDVEDCVEVDNIGGGDYNTLSTAMTLTPLAEDGVAAVIGDGDSLTNSSPKPLFSFSSTRLHWTRVLSPVVVLSLVIHLLA